MNWDVFTVLDLLGTLAFAVSGASLAIKKEFDVFGVYVLAFVTSIGGGTVRDILIGNTPVEWMSNNAIIITIVIGASLTLIFNPIISKLNFFVYLFERLICQIFKTKQYMYIYIYLLPHFLSKKCLLQ